MLQLNREEGDSWGQVGVIDMLKLKDVLLGLENFVCI